MSEPKPVTSWAHRRCVRFGCHYATLVWLEQGQSLQTANGFLIARIPGWYCPKCSGGYGGSKS